MSAFSGALQPSYVEAAEAADLIQEKHRRDPGLEISRSEAEALFALDRMQPESTSVWREFVAGAIAAHLSAEAPAGILTEEKVKWLLGCAAPQGRVESPAAFEVIIRALECACEACAQLSAFAIRQLQAAIISGEGAALDKREHFSRTVDAEDATQLNRILIAAGGAEGRPVSREEADALFDLHDAVARSQNDSSFNDLFCRAIMNYTLAASGHALEPRKETLAPEYVPGAHMKPSSEMAAWLSERIMRDGQPTLPEFELLLLIGSAPLKTDTSLQRLLAI